MADIEFGHAPMKERADAARNRAKILAATARLFEQHAVAAVSMDQIPRPGREPGREVTWANVTSDDRRPWRLP